MDFMEVAAHTSWARRHSRSVALAVAQSMWGGVPLRCLRLSQLTFRHAIAVSIRTGFLPDAARTKHAVYFSMIAVNSFLDEHVKEQILDCMCAAQRVRWTLAGALRRRAAILARRPGGSPVDTDLSLEPILSRTWRHLVTYHEHGKRYVFYIPDLLTYWRARLLQQVWMDPDPQPPDNPYTREPTSHEALSAICVAARLQGFRLPRVLRQYWAAGCDIEELMRTGGHCLREAAIVSHAMEGGEELYSDVCDIICVYPELIPNVALPPAVPVVVARHIVDLFRPALVEYGRMSYGTTDETRAAGRRGLATALMRLNEEHKHSSLWREIMVRSDGCWRRVWRI